MSGNRPPLERTAEEEARNILNHLNDLIGYASELQYKTRDPRCASLLRQISHMGPLARDIYRDLRQASGGPDDGKGE